MFYNYICKNDKCKNHYNEVTISKKMSECSREEFCPICGVIMERPISSYHGNYKSTNGFYAESQS